MPLHKDARRDVRPVRPRRKGPLEVAVPVGDGQPDSVQMARTASGPRGPKAPPPVKARLALARHLQELLDTGLAESRADLARQFKVSRAAITQLMRLMRLAPEIMEHVEAMSGADGEYRITERDCRRFVRLGGQKQQVAAFRRWRAAQVFGGESSGRTKT